MTKISRSGPRRWIAALLLLVMALSTAALAEGSVCLRTSQHNSTALAPQPGPDGAALDLIDTTSQPATPTDIGTPPASAPCGATAQTTARGPDLIDPPLDDEAPLPQLVAPPPAPEPNSEIRPPRWS